MLLILGIIAIPQQSALGLTSSRQSPSNVDLVEVSPPEAIQILRTKVDQYNPQVKILSPAMGQMIKDDTVSVRLEVRDLPIFKDASLGLGPHLYVFLDNQPAQEIYDLSQPLIFKELTPGTHTIRAVASRPWFESFKNPGAYAQTTFHVFTQTDENRPSPTQPLLTYGQPQGTFGTDTVLLDFYLSNLSKTISSDSKAGNWQALVSIDGSSFYVNDWQPIYIKGLQPGKHWVRLELTDRQGQKVENAFSDTVRIIEVQENGTDALSKLIRGDLSARDAGGVIDPNYKRPQPLPVKIPTAPSPAPSPPASKVQPPTIEAPKQETSPAPAAKEPKADPVKKSAPVESSARPRPESPAATSVSPPKLKNIKPKEIDENPARPSAETSMPTQVDEKQAPKIPNNESSPPPLKSAPLKSKQELPKASEKLKITVPEQPKPSQGELPKPSLSLEKDRKLNTLPVLPKQSLSSPSKLENQKPKAVDKSAPKVPTEKSTPAKKVSPAPAKLKTSTEDSAPGSAQSVQSKPSVTVPNSPAKTKVTDQKIPNSDESSSLKSTLTKFWNQVNPAQGQTPPAPAPSSSDNKESVKPEALKPSQISGSTPVKKTPTQPAAKPSLPKAVKPGSTKPSQSRATSQSRSSTPGGNKTQSSQEPALKETPDKTLPLSSPPANNAKSAQPAPSIFSSLQDRWQQQKQLISPQKKETVSTTPLLLKTAPTTGIAKPNVGQSTIPKPVVPKSAKSRDAVKRPSKVTEDRQDDTKTAQPSGSDAQSSLLNSVFSSVRNRWQQEKQLMSSDRDQVVPPSPANTAVQSKQPLNQSPTKPQVQPSASPTGPAQATPPGEKQSRGSQLSTPSSQPESIFSSWRDRWQQEKPSDVPVITKQTPPTTPPSKTTDKAGRPSSRLDKKSSPVKSSVSKKPGNVDKSAPSQTAKDRQDRPGLSTSPDSADQMAQPNAIFSTLRDRWQQQQKQVTSPATKAIAPAPSSPTPSPSIKTNLKPIPSQSVKAKPSQDKSVDRQQDVSSSQAQAEESESLVFDPGVLYRRWLSKDKVSSPKLETKAMTTSPSSSVAPTKSIKASPKSFPSQSVKAKPSQSIKAKPSQAVKPTSSQDKSVDRQQDVSSSQAQTEESESLVFDPGVLYRRWLSKDTTPSPKVETKAMTASPSS